MNRSKKQKSGRGKIRRQRQQRQKRQSKIRHWASSISYTWSLVVGISVLMTIVGTIYALTPKISVQPYGSLNPADPFSTPFIITNDSTLPIHNVSSKYEANNIEGVEMEGEKSECSTCPDISIGGFSSGDTQPIVQMEPGEKTPLFVGGMTLAKPSGEIKDTSAATNAEIIITVKYRPDWIPWQQERRWKFITAMNVEGQLVWVPVPIGL